MNVTEITVELGGKELGAILSSPPNFHGMIIFAHGSGSSRHSPRNQFVAAALNRRGFATLLADLLTYDENQDRANVFDLDLLAERLISLSKWARTNILGQNQKIGYFGASTGGGAALEAAALKPELVSAVVSRGGRPDLAVNYLGDVKAPTLLLVGGEDGEVIEMNRFAYERLNCPCELRIIPGAGHLFEEPGTLEQVASLASDWFSKFLTKTDESHVHRV